MHDEQAVRDEDPLALLEERVRRVEDELAILRLLASYGPLVDVGDADNVAELWVENGSYHVDGFTLQGREAIRRMVRSSAHQGFIRAGSLHFLGLPLIEVRGDAAVATCESMLVLHDDGQFTVRRGTANHFEFCRTPLGWRISTRTSQLLDGTETARNLLRVEELESSAE